MKTLADREAKMKFKKCMEFANSGTLDSQKVRGSSAASGERNDQQQDLHVRSLRSEAGYQHGWITSLHGEGQVKGQNAATLSENKEMF